MVSGFFTSPCDQSRIFCGAASLMRMAPKVMGFGWRSRMPQRSRAGFSSRTRLPNVRSVSILAISFYSVRLRRRLLVLGDELHVQRQTLQFLHEHVEGLRGTRLEEVFSLHDRLVDPVPTLDIVRLAREHLLQRVGGAV